MLGSRGGCFAQGRAGREHWRACTEHAACHGSEVQAWKEREDFPLLIVFYTKEAGPGMGVYAVYALAYPLIEPARPNRAGYAPVMARGGG